MLVTLLLVLQLIMLIPGRSWSTWKELPDDSFSWNHSLQMMEDNFEDYISSLELHLQKLNDLVEEYMGVLDKLVKSHVQDLWEWLEEHIKAFNTWLNVHFWTLQECNDTYNKDVDSKLGKCWEEPIDQAFMWLDHTIVITLSEWFDEGLPIVYKALLDSYVDGSLQDNTDADEHHLQDHVHILGQFFDNYTANASKELEGHVTVEKSPSQKYASDFLDVDPKAQKLRSQVLKVK